MELLAQLAFALDVEGLVDGLVGHLELRSSAWFLANQHEICLGDQRRSRPRSTARLRRGQVASFPGLGRQARSQARRSAVVARYWRRPPLRSTSRLTVEGARPSCSAIARRDQPLASPLEISSRSSKDNTRSERILGLGRIPPASRSTVLTVSLLMPSDLAAVDRSRPALNCSQT